MRYGSVCSGIEAATQAWHPLGWSPAFFSEIEKFPSAVLAHHYGSNMPGEPLAENGVPNLGDMKRYEEWPDEPIDLLVGGTPCQSFSVAGLRQGLADPRGNLMLTYLAIARRYQPRWLVWENVPGVLSSNEGRDFGTFLRGLEECGYHAAWRVLDAQYVRVDGYERAVPQRRRRVFVVGYLGDWRRAAAVFLEREGLCGDSPPRREAGEGIAPTISARPTGGGGLGTDFDCDGGLVVDDAARCVTAGYAQRLDWETENFVAFDCKASGRNGFGIGQISPTLRSMGHANSHQNAGGQVAVAIQERAVAENPGSGPDGKGWCDDGSAYTLEARATAQAVAFAQNSRDEVRMVGGDGGVAGALSAEPGMKQTTYVAAFKGGQGSDAGGIGFDEHVSPTLSSADSGSNRTPALLQGWKVRRLTPRECERLQGFPDDFTQIPWRGKDIADCPDGPRYKALGNSMAVNCMRWIGQRIEHVESIAERAAA